MGVDIISYAVAHRKPSIADDVGLGVVIVRMRMSERRQLGAAARDGLSKTAQGFSFKLEHLILIEFHVVNHFLSSIGFFF